MKFPFLAGNLKGMPESFIWDPYPTASSFQGGEEILKGNGAILSINELWERESRDSVFHTKEMTGKS